MFSDQNKQNILVGTKTGTFGGYERASNPNNIMLACICFE